MSFRVLRHPPPNPWKDGDLKGQGSVSSLELPTHIRVTDRSLGLLHCPENAPAGLFSEVFLLGNEEQLSARCQQVRL